VVQLSVQFRYSLFVMSDGVQFPLSYELNTRVWLAELSRRYGYRVTLANVPDEELQRLNDFHFDVIWLMGVWQTGSYSRELALRDEELLRYLAKVLPDWTEADIISSPYSVSAYRVSEDLGGRCRAHCLQGQTASAFHAIDTGLCSESHRCGMYVGENKS